MLICGIRSSTAMKADAFSGAMQAEKRRTHGSLAASPMPMRVNEPLHTQRDSEILAALDRTPLTARQILKLSRTFAVPFTDERRVRERLQLLCAARRVRQFVYATAGQGAPAYYVLSPLGFKLLH